MNMQVILRPGLQGNPKANTSHLILNPTNRRVKTRHLLVLSRLVLLYLFQALDQTCSTPWPASSQTETASINLKHHLGPTLKTCRFGSFVCKQESRTTHVDHLWSNHQVLDTAGYRSPVPAKLCSILGQRSRFFNHSRNVPLVFRHDVTASHIQALYIFEPSLVSKFAKRLGSSGPRNYQQPSSQLRAFHGVCR
jgi:hypothetical protein